MRKFMSLFKLTVVLATVVALLPHAAEAQRRRNQQNLKQILIAPPLPESDSDSAFVIEFAAELRDRLAGRVRNQMRVVTNERYCEALEASGFGCATILDETSTEQLARFVSADSYISGRFHGGAAPRVKMRLVDFGRSGLGGVMELTGEPGIDASDFANFVADTLRSQVRAAREVQQCNDRRDRSDFRGARERANRAFTLYPNHPGAALCLAYVFEATQQPEDSLIWAYQKCTAGDPQNDRCSRRTSQLFLAKGDTLGAIRTFHAQLNANPTDVEQRETVARMYAESNLVDSAIVLLDEAQGLLDGEAEDRLMLVKTGICVEDNRFDCVFEAYERRYEIKPDLASDTTFLAGVIGAADFAGDTTGSLKWTGIAVLQFSDRVSYLTAHAVQLVGVGLSDSAMTINRRILDLEPENTQASLSVAQVLVGELVIDSTIPLDTVLTMEIDSILTAVAGRSSNERVSASVGGLYVTPGLRMAQLQANGNPRWAADWLSKGLEYPVRQATRQRAQFFLGFVTIFYLSDLFTEVQEANSCEAVSMYERHVARGRAAMEAGRGLSEVTAEQFLGTQYPAYEQVIPQFRQQLSCAN